MLRGIHACEVPPMKYRSIMCIAFGLALALSACGKKDEDQPAGKAGKAGQTGKAGQAGKAGGTAKAAKTPAEEARGMFDTLCQTCHGKTGLGDGIAAANLEAKPRNYTDKEWQAKATDENLAKAIVEGGPAVGLNAAMPPNPTLKDKPKVVAELIKIIRAFGK